MYLWLDHVFAGVNANAETHGSINVQVGRKAVIEDCMPSYHGPKAAGEGAVLKMA